MAAQMASTTVPSAGMWRRGRSGLADGHRGGGEALACGVALHAQSMRPEPWVPKELESVACGRRLGERLCSGCGACFRRAPLFAAWSRPASRAVRSWAGTCFCMCCPGAL